MIILIYLLGVVLCYGRLNSFAFQFELERKKYNNVLDNSSPYLLTILASWGGLFVQIVIESLLGYSETWSWKTFFKFSDWN